MRWIIIGCLGVALGGCGADGAPIRPGIVDSNATRTEPF